MTVEDIGPEPSAFDLESETTSNQHYRAVAWTLPLAWCVGA